MDTMDTMESMEAMEAMDTMDTVDTMDNSERSGHWITGSGQGPITTQPRGASSSSISK